MCTEKADLVELRKYIDILRRHRWLLIKAVVLVAAGAWLLSSLQTPVYRAKAKVLLRPNDPSEQLNPTRTNTGFSDTDHFVAAQVDVVKSEAVALLAAKSLRHARAQVLLNQITVTQNGTSQTLGVAATDLDPARARDIANAFAHSYIENRRTNAVEGLQRATTDIETRLQSIQTRIADLDHQIATVGRKGVGATNTPTGPTPATPAPQSGIQPPDSPGLDTGGQPTTEEGIKAARYAAALQYQSLYARQQELLVDITLKRGEAEMLSDARTPTTPFKPRPKQNALLGGFVGLLLGLAIALLREQLDDRIHSREELERLTELPVLAELPFEDEFVTNPDRVAAAESPLGSLAEASRGLRSSIQFLGIDKPIKLLLITSAGPGEGKSVVAANLAVVYAQAGFRTVLVSADLRRPRVELMFHGGFDTVGVTGVVSQLAEKRRQPWRAEPVPAAQPDAPDVSPDAVDAVRKALRPTDIENLLVLPAGPRPPNPAELLGSKRMSEMLSALEQLADIVVVDSPPLLAVTDAAVLASRADGVALVSALGEARRDGVRRAATTLRTSHARILGVVVNKTDSSGDNYYGGYYHTATEQKGRFGRRKLHPVLPDGDPIPVVPAGRRPSIATPGVDAAAARVAVGATPTEAAHNGQVRSSLDRSVERYGTSPRQRGVLARLLLGPARDSQSAPNKPRRDR